MITLEDAVLYRGAKRVLDRVSVSVPRGRKVGVVGDNGAGKTSLLALIAGELQADAGRVERAPRMRVATVAQDVATRSEQRARSATAFVLDGWRELRELENELAVAERRGDGTRHANALARFEDLGGYQAEPRAKRILSGLGVNARDHDRAMREFSGGWQMRAALARALMQPSDLLLLDEPTNHLDLDAVLWLEDWLTRYPGTLLLISHDREFLNAVVGHVLHVANARISLYAGNYDQFERARAEALAQQAKAYARQQREIAHVQKFIERFRYKASKARQAQSRLKLLERMQQIVPAHVDTPFQFTVEPPERTPNPLLSVEGAGAGYDGNVVIDGVSISLSPGSRIGLLGRNGAGKSTFVKLLAGELAPIRGQREAAPDLVCGYFAQHDVDRLSPERSALEHLKQMDPTLGEQRARDVLGRFGFSGDDTLRAVATFSGGERARLTLALIFQLRPNLLLLDEPTNHLDLEMRQALAVALNDYPGAIVLVSHDRYLLGSIADELWLVRDASARPFDGDLDDYARWLRRGDAAMQQERPAKSARGASRSADTAAARRKLGYREQRELDSLPEKIEHMEAELGALRARLADPEFLRGAGDAIAEASRALGDLEFDLARAYSRWQELEDQA